jgi:hypothetical protein
VAVIVVPHNIDKSGKIAVIETMEQIDRLIEAARKGKRQTIWLRRLNRDELRIRWSLIQAIERGGR